ncbi:lipase ROG1 family protein Ecym_3560 [Eremothecium cymbalariae DBVPG|uniref:DUF676 domain-containing protein n=1 Tax=Eremothecium cymbalariae (strain CBS 270.75 / DBVPG 7215 / KCTC 17166 / NRRL Y-17582) TaxID=931890 RepID=G8JQP7_ERECY|nr:Hypothetical protein Ecym_3560 [Eremothecium cymbalariae DBVPG\
MAQVHLIVFVHGLWGNISHMDYLSNAIVARSNNSKETLAVYSAKMNQGYRTYDGIDICGFRVASEIEEQILIINSSKPGTIITKFSIIGYSLGGLIARYAIGLLYSKQVFKKYEIRLLNFTTFCSPHAGVYAPGSNIAVKLFNAICPVTMGSSGKQMFLKDKVTAADDISLIYLMSLEDSIFYKALASFKYRSLYANVINDKRTAWWTSGISLNDPFFDVNEFNGVDRFHYVPGYEPVVIDNTKAINIASISELLDIELPTSFEQAEPDPQEYYFINYWVDKLVCWATVLVNLLIIAPIWVIWFILSGLVQTANSTIRVTKFVNNYSHQLVNDYFDADHEITGCSTSQLNEADSDEYYSVLIPHNEYEYQIERSLQDKTDTLIESVFEAIERRNTLTGATQGVPPTKATSFSITIQDLESMRIGDIETKNEKQRELLQNFHLGIDQRQAEIITALNKLSWKKFPIYIRATPNTHACAIARYKDPKFKEGEVVINHWCDEVFQFD